jgi:replicative DNA helicase
MIYPDNSMLSDIEKLCSQIEDAVKRYNIKIVCFDNLHFLVRDDVNVASRIGFVTRRFKILAETLGVVFFLIVHPRKMDKKGPPGPNDLKDSSSIFQDLDSLIILHRRDKGNDSFDVDEELESGTETREAITEVYTYSRYGDGGKTLLLYNGQRSTFVDSGDEYRESVERYRKLYFNAKKQLRS